MLFVTLCAFLFFFFTQVFYYLFIFSKFAFKKPEKGSPKRIPISVIVCAKNEAENVAEFIPLLAEQIYPTFEIVLIDDASSDNTLELFEEFQKQYANIKIVKVQNNEAFWGNKKFALTLGIKAATYEYLLFTDADCRPASNKWIQEMSSHYTIHRSIVLGYGAYEKVAGSFLNKLIRFETLLTAVQYFSWARMGWTYMGVGRNLGYKKEEFFNVNGFISHMKIRSGDDDLFINQAATATNTSVCYSPESFTYSKPKTSFKEWLTQKRRHIATASYYRPSHKIILSTFYISQVLVLLLGAVLLGFQYYWTFVAGLLAFRYALVWISLGFSAKRLKEKDLTFLYPILELTLVMTQLYLYLTNLFTKPVHWK
jgi:glycosyltransferase involved in cell wall biosynthesis